MAPFIKEKRFVLGGLLILVGVVLLAGRFDHGLLPHWLFSWQMIIIAIGVFSLLTHEHPTPGFIMIGVGSIFLVNRYFYPVFHNFMQWWPVVFIIAGVLVIFSLSRRGWGEKKGSYNRGWGGDAATSESTEDVLDEVAMFGGGSRKITSQNFKGGRLTAVFGGSEIDLSQANLAEGVNVLEVTAVFGGWELIVPAHWHIEFKITPIFGGFSDKRNLGHASDPVDNTRKLIVSGVAIFGGGEMKSYARR